MTGLEREQVDALVAAVAQRLPLWSKGRPFAPGLYRSVLIVLVMMRQNPVQRFVAAIFDTSQSTVSRRWTGLRDPVREVLAELVPEPAAIAGSSTVVIDGTLAPTSQWQHREDLYSGKHKRCGFNLQVACLLDGTLVGVGRAIYGSHHDVYAWHECGLETALADTVEHDRLLADLGYIGVRGVIHGHRRPIGGTLTDQQRHINREIAHIRVIVERVIAHLKHWKILGHPYRGPLDDYRATAECAIALEFYRLSGNPLTNR